MKILLSGMVGLVIGILLTLGTIRFLDPRGRDVRSSSEIGAQAELSISRSPEVGRSSSARWNIDDQKIPIRRLEEIAKNMAVQDPVAAIERAGEIKGYDLREAFLSAVCYTWGESNGEEAALWITENLSGTLRTDALYFASDGWAESDPESTADWLMENTEGAVLEDGVWEALESWGRKNPKEAFEWAGRLDEYDAYNVMDGLAEGWAAVDPAAAAEAAIALIDKPYSNMFLSAVATQWAGTDPEAALEWSDRILREDLREGVLSEIGKQWAALEPEDAAKRIAAIENPGNRRFALSGLADGWSEHDPVAALQWTIDSVEDTATLRTMVDDILFNWTLADPRGTADWLQTAEASPGRDLTIEAFGTSIFHEDPFSAISWANEISDSAIRDPLLKKMIGQYYSAGGDRAISELQQVELPPRIAKEFIPNLVGSDDSTESTGVDQ